MSYRTPPNIREVRLRAWATRRQKYGPSGHKGSYARWESPGAPTPSRDGMLSLLIDLHLSAVVSEGQLAKATGLNRIELRRLVDECRQRTNRDYAA